MSTEHTVKQGECLLRIAHQYGFGGDSKLRHDSGNKEFMDSYSKSGVLFPGTKVAIPEIEPRTERGQTETQHRFQIELPCRVVRIVIRDMNNQPLSNLKWSLHAGDAPFEGKTDANGLLETALPIDVQGARLEAGGFHWNLGIGCLNPLSDQAPDRGISGAQGRLSNLGYDTGPVDGVLGKITRAALRQFQKNCGLEPSGDLDSKTKSKLAEEYGC